MNREPLTTGFTRVAMTHELREMLKARKVHPREAYEDVIRRLISEHEAAKAPA